jgi:hypothetical protein
MPMRRGGAFQKWRIPRTATADAEPGLRMSTPSDETHVDNLTRPAATRTALGAATAFGPSR